MIQLSKAKTILYHLYPGVIITVGFVIGAPVAIDYGFPPQFAMLVSILLIALPLLIKHLFVVKKVEDKKSLWEINGFTNQLSIPKLILYSIGLTIFAFISWGATQPITKFMSEHLFNWLPDWFTTQSLEGYSSDKIKLTLLLNLILNGILAPLVEELYFRGYLLPRMNAWGKNAFLVNAVQFSFYHFWQPYIYATLIIALLPLTYFTWKTGDIRLAITTHCLMNVIGAVLSFGSVLNS